MKKIIFSLFILLILSNQYASSQNRLSDIIPNYFKGSWSLDGDKLNLELYSEWDLGALHFCSLILYDNKDRKFNEIIGGDLNITIKPKTIVKKSIYLPNFYKEIKKAKSLKLNSCNDEKWPQYNGIEVTLDREKGVVNKSLDKIFGR